MTVQEILDEWNQEGPLSPDTLREAAALREEITPHLIEILERATADTEHYVKDTACDAHLCALFMLAQFREPSACAAVANFCRMRPDLLDELIDDLVTEDLARILAAVCDGDTAPIRALIEDTAANEYARGAAIESLKIMAMEGIVARDEVMAYFKELFNARLEREKCSSLRSELVCEAVDLYPGEVEEEIREAFREELMDDCYISLREVQEALDGGPEFCRQRAARHYKGLLIDAAAEVPEWQRYISESGWDVDDEEEEPPITVLDEMRGYKAGFHQDNALDRREGIKVGPNDPCPCGSGKKHKKCCGRMDADPPPSH